MPELFSKDSFQLYYVVVSPQEFRYPPSLSVFGLVNLVGRFNASHGHIIYKLFIWSILRRFSSVVEQLIRNERVNGSNPLSGSPLKRGFASHVQNVNADFPTDVVGARWSLSGGFGADSVATVATPDIARRLGVIHGPLQRYGASVRSRFWYEVRPANHSVAGYHFCPSSRWGSVGNKMILARSAFNRSA